MHGCMDARPRVQLYGTLQWISVYRTRTTCFVHYREVVLSLKCGIIGKCAMSDRVSDPLSEVPVVFVCSCKPDKSQICCGEYIESFLDFDLKGCILFCHVPGPCSSWIPGIKPCPLMECCKYLLNQPWLGFCGLCISILVYSVVLTSC